jgi:ribose transport system substrate-binding protein
MMSSSRKGAGGQPSHGRHVIATRREILLYGAGLAFAASGLPRSASSAPGPFKIALSNAYNGNEWRRQHAKAFEQAAAELKAKGIFSEYTAVHGSDNSVPAQLAAIGDMILKGNNGIMINCSSGSQVGGVIEQAADAGIKVVSYDAYASSDRSHNIGFDFSSWGKNNADFIENHLGGAGKAQGNVLIINLSLGATAGKLIRNEYQKMLDRNPGLKVVGEVEGQATRSVAQRNVAQVVPGLPKIDAVLGAGGNDSFGIVEGMLASGYTMENMPPICTGADGEYIKWWREARDKYGYKATGLNADPAIGAWATYYMAHILIEDDNEPKDWYAPSVPTTNENLDGYGDVPGEGVPMQSFTFEQIPSVFTRTDKLPG